MMLRGIDTLSGGVNSLEMVFASLFERVYYTRKTFAPFEGTFFYCRVDHFSERLGMQNRKSQKLSPL